MLLLLNILFSATTTDDPLAGLPRFDRFNGMMQKLYNTAGIGNNKMV